MLMNVVSSRQAVRTLEDKVLGLILSLRLNLSLRIRHCLSPSLSLSLNLIISLNFSLSYSSNLILPLNLSLSHSPTFRLSLSLSLSRCLILYLVDFLSP